MTQQFENFVNAALDKSLSSDVTLPTADDIPVFTGIGRQVTGKTIAELGLALTADVGVLSDSTFRIQDNDDATKQLAFEVGGIATEQTKTITMPNADTLGSVYRKEINNLRDNNQNSILLIENFGKKHYFNAMYYSTLLLGNTSSGIIEAASFGKYVINVGDRQKGRTQSLNVYDVNFDSFFLN